MSDVAPLLDLLPVLGIAFGAGGVTQLARQLARSDPPRARRVLALAAAAGIAALTVVALLTALLRPPPVPALLLAAACVTGWSGPGILTRLGGVIERRLGLAALDPEDLPRRNGRHRTYRHD
ncbi:hypothetical protein DAETH_26180 [Deinococcus aetherius]|uniref:Uncharacterized protein n=1 Tax=Deinococcus aetherius TaxID=200252 RepID=A0ABM8AFS6_9DEIO|nr:hypothetical protein [Deinococcus aetherius]BDP42649.1 hypothetical protein DAETH_26180 [Deinococcus aetherius]